MIPPQLTLSCTLVSLSVSIGNLIILLYTLTKFLSKPSRDKNEAQDGRITLLEKRADNLEKRADKVDAKLTNGNTHFKAIDEGNSVTQAALIAIMDALLTGDNKEELQKARNELNSYLINK